MKIIITAGGGGHFAPALAVMKKLPKDDVLFIGRKYAFEGDSAESFEYKTVTELAIPFRTITTGRLQRTVSFRSLVSLSKMPVGFWQAIRILRQFKPDVVVSFGGYVALPVTIAAFLMKIPVVVHEQTMRAGLANKIAGRFAAAICLTFPSSERYFPRGKTTLTGNPLREEFHAGNEERKYFSSTDPIIFVTGGSLGSHAINLLIEGMLPKLLKKYQILHQTGDAQEFRDYDRLKHLHSTLPEELRNRYIVQKFISSGDIALVLKKSSLVIARSGINTVMELLYFKKPSLLIPLPHGQKNEQQENAEFLKKIGLARVKSQEELTPETMYTEIEAMMDELGSYRLNRDVSTIIQKDAAEKIIATILSVTKKLHQKAEEKTEG